MTKDLVPWGLSVCVGALVTYLSQQSPVRAGSHTEWLEDTQSFFLFLGLLGTVPEFQ